MKFLRVGGLTQQHRVITGATESSEPRVFVIVFDVGVGHQNFGVHHVFVVKSLTVRVAQLPPNGRKDRHQCPHEQPERDVLLEGSYVLGDCVFFFIVHDTVASS